MQNNIQIRYFFTKNKFLVQKLKNIISSSCYDTLYYIIVGVFFAYLYFFISRWFIAPLIILCFFLPNKKIILFNILVMIFIFFLFYQKFFNDNKNAKYLIYNYKTYESINLKGTIYKDSIFSKKDFHIHFLKVNFIKTDKINIKTDLKFVFINDQYMFFKGDEVEISPDFISNKISNENSLFGTGNVKFFHISKSYRNIILKDLQNHILLYPRFLSSLMYALLLGKKEYLLPGLKEDFYDLGYAYMIALSGMHLSVIFFLFQKIFLSYHKVLNIFFIAFCIFYIFLLNFIPSLSRACFQAIIMSFCLIFLIDIDRKRSLTISFVFQILLFKYSLLNMGFVFSYVCMLAIYYLYPIIKKFIKISYLSLYFSISILTFPLLLIYGIKAKNIIFGVFSIFVNYIIFLYMLTSIIALIFLYVFGVSSIYYFSCLLKILYDSMVIFLRFLKSFL